MGDIDPLEVDDDKYGKHAAKSRAQTFTIAVTCAVLLFLGNVVLSVYKPHARASGAGGDSLYKGVAANGPAKKPATRGLAGASASARFQQMGIPGGFNDRIEELIKTTGCTTNFFLAWTTPAEQFSLRYRRTVESTLRFHPHSCVIVLSNTLPKDYFQTFWNLGYNIIVERPDSEKLLKGTPAEAWLTNIAVWKEGPFFFSHITEILRLSTLWHYGGVYLDTDVIIMKALKPDLQNCLGTELAGKYGEAKVLNGAILIFEKGSRFVWEAMVEFNTTYRIDSWGWNGPELVTRVARRFQHYEQLDKDDKKKQGTKPRKLFYSGQQESDMGMKDLTILPTDAFYPIHWARVKKYFSLAEPQDQYEVWDRIQKHTYLFHYWNKVG